MEEQKNDPSLSTEVENLSQTSQSNDNRPPQNEDSPQTSQSNDDRLPLDERRPCNNFKLPAFWKHNAGSWIALIEAKFRMSKITTQINKYMAVLEALNNSELERLYNIPKPEDENCYDKLITQIHDIFTRDDQDRLDLLLNDLTLGDKTPNELMRHLISAAGVEDNCSPQFEAILKDRFLRCLPPDIAASSGTWSYTNLRSLAKCATQAMNTTQRYGKPQSVLTIGNKPRNITSSHFSPNSARNNSDGRVNFFRPQGRENFSRRNIISANARGNWRKPIRQPNYQTNGWPHNSRYDQSQNRYRSYSGYVCYYHRLFKQAAYRCEGPNCKFFSSPYRTESLNCEGRQLRSLH